MRGGGRRAAGLVWRLFLGIMRGVRFCLAGGRPDRLKGNVRGRVISRRRGMGMGRSRGVECDDVMYGI